MAVPILLSTAIGAVSGGASAFAAGAAAGAFWSAVGVNAVLGAAVGALGLLVQPGKPKSNRETAAVLSTTNQHNVPVPVVFGRARVAGNYLAVGNFHYWGTHVSDNGGQVYLMHAAIAFCEGPIRSIGNFRIDNKSRKDLIADLVDKGTGPDGLDESAWYLFKANAGTPTQEIPPMIIDAEADVYPTGTPAPCGFTNILSATNAIVTTEDATTHRAYVTTNQIPVPWRNTCVAAVQLYTGYDVGLASVNADIEGPRFAMHETDTTSGESFPDTPYYVGYDGFEESFWYPAQTGPTAPSGLVRVPRDGSGTREHTAPPDDCTLSIQKGWYLGRHDVVVMQDPSQSDLFYIGYWGITRGSADWERVRPHLDYTNPILNHHLDELHGILHSLHTDGSTYYVLRWNLLTGRIDRVDIAVSTSVSSFYAFAYSADVHQYVFAGVDGSIYQVDPNTGEILSETDSINLVGCKGVFVSGVRVGVVFANGVIFWDSESEIVSGRYGTSGTALTAGYFGGTTSAIQNTWTGHITLGGKTQSSNAAFINFIASVVEEVEDMSANGSPTEYEFQWSLDADHKPITGQDDINSWIRDWSYRTANRWSLNQLEGRSSVAAAMYATLTDVRDSARWGAGLSADYFSMSSFEALHSRCVAAWRYRNTPKTIRSTTTSSETTGIDPGVCYSSYTLTFFVESYVFGCHITSASGGAHELVESTPTQPDAVRQWQDSEWVMWTVIDGTNYVHYVNHVHSTLPYLYTATTTGFGTGTCPTTTLGDWTVNPDARMGCGDGHVSMTAIAGTDTPITVGESGGGEDVTIPTTKITYRYAEKYKFDYLLDNQARVSDLITGEMLACANGFRYMLDGKLCVGVPLAGAFPIWHFGNDQTADGETKLSFIGRQGLSNRTRIQYINIRKDYAADFVQADDEFDQNRFGRVAEDSISLSGISRAGHAEIIAKTRLDNLMQTRRRVEFNTHWLGFVITPGDTIEVSNAQLGISRMPCKVVELSESASQAVSIVAEEYRPITESVRPTEPGDSPEGCLGDFQWDTGVVSEHVMGGSSSFIRSSEAFTLDTSVIDEIAFSGVTDDFTILTSSADSITQTYSGVAGDPVTITLPTNYVMFRNTYGSLRAGATVAKTITDGTHTSTIPAGDGGAYDQVIDLEADGFSTRDLTTPVTAAEMTAMGWVGTDGVARLKVWHVVSGNGRANITAATCTPATPPTEEIFLAWDTGETTDATRADRRWWTTDPVSVVADITDHLFDVPSDSGWETPLISYRAAIVERAILGNTDGTGPGGWPAPILDNTDWISGKATGQYEGDPDETAPLSFWTYFYISDYYGTTDEALARWSFGLAATGDNAIAEVWLNDVQVYDVACYPGYSNISIPPSKGQFNKALHSPLQIGWNKVMIKVSSYALAKGMYAVWDGPLFGDWCSV